MEALEANSSPLRIKNQEKWRLPILFPHVPWYWLAIIFLAITLIAISEGSFREYRKRVRLASSECERLQLLLDAEQAKNSEPKLAGRIDCLDHDVAWDLERFGLDEAIPMKLRVVFALNVTLWNETPAATTVSEFSLRLLWQDGQYQADKLPVEDYARQRSFPRSEALEWGYEVKQEPLVAFPYHVEITNRNHTSGWLRFLARDIPGAASDNAVLRDDVTWKLFAHDRKGQQHTIYEGSLDLPPCGSIEKYQTRY